MSRGHTLEEMLSLTPLELAFYRQAWGLELEYIAGILGGMEHG